MEKNVLPEINDVFTRKEIAALLKQRVFVPPESLFSAPELISQTSCLKSTHNTASCCHGLRGIPPLTLSQKPLSTAPVYPPQHRRRQSGGVWMSLGAGAAQGRASRRQLPAVWLQGDESPPCINTARTNQPAWGLTALSRESTPGDLFLRRSAFRQRVLQTSLLRDAPGKRFNISQCNALLC